MCALERVLCALERVLRALERVLRALECCVHWKNETLTQMWNTESVSKRGNSQLRIEGTLGKQLILPPECLTATAPFEIALGIGSKGGTLVTAAGRTS